jgi:hypothetical protein
MHRVYRGRRDLVELIAIKKKALDILRRHRWAGSIALPSFSAIRPISTPGRLCTPGRKTALLPCTLPASSDSRKRLAFD